MGVINFATAEIEGQGKISLKMTLGKVVTLNNILHVLEIRKNLVSIALLVKHGVKCVFVADKIVLSKNDMYVGKGYLAEGLFKLNVIAININKSTNSSYLLESPNFWHERLGYANYKILRKMINFEVLPVFECKNAKYQICEEAKYVKHPYKYIERNSSPLDLIHINICDMKSIPSCRGKRYFITFIDDSTGYCYIYLPKSRDEAIDTFKQYKSEVETQLGKRIKAIRSDRGGEYESPFEQICLENGIIHQTTTPYTPQSNRIEERKNRTLKEIMNSLLISSGLPHNLWGKLF